MARVQDVATYFIQLAGAAVEPEPLTTLKLQKLLYYAQSLSIANRRVELFSNKIKAWSNGPVVPEIWHLFKGQKFISCEETHTTVELSIEDRVFVRQIWTLYGKYTGDALSQMTHAEAPWKAARGSLPPDAASDAEITSAAMREFFEPQQIALPAVARPVEIRRGREVYRIEDAAKVLPAGI